MLEIKKFTATQLWTFVNSDEFLTMKDVPVSRMRAWSYLHNPRISQDDIIFYIGYFNHEMVTYRGIMPDYLFNGELKIKVGWLSGNWVMPQYRRNGFATQMFNEAKKDWNNYLLYTNYAPESKAVYDKTGAFNTYKSLPGVRFYLRSDMSSLLPVKNKFFKTIRPLFKLADYGINLFLDFRSLIFYTYSPKINLKYEFLSYFDNESVQFIETFNSTNSFSQRDKTVFDWITQFPWVIQSPMKDDVNDRYFFSSTFRQFERSIVKVYNLENKICALIFLSIKDGAASIPYLICNNQDVKQAMNIIRKIILKRNIHYLTVYNSDSVERMQQISSVFFARKKMIRNYMVSCELSPLLPNSESVYIHDGEGDVVFV